MLPLLILLLLSSLDLVAGIPATLSPGPRAAAPDFVENRGQWDRRAIYRADQGALGVWFTTDGVVYDLAGPGTRYALRQRFAGGRRVRPLGAGPAGARRRYPGAGIGDVISRGFGEIRYDDVYPGIDVRYYGHDGGLKYDMLVGPGADPSRIAISYEGAVPEVTPDGTVRLATPLGQIIEGRPYSYQIVDGRRVEVPSRFVRSGDRIGFRVGAYDRARPLVIDPALIYSSYLGGTPTLNGTGADSAHGIGLDAGGNIYVAGVTRSENFPTTIGSITLARLPDVFVAKFDPTGSALLYATVLGGSGADLPAGIRVSRAGVVTVAGTTFSSDFPTSAQAFDRTFSGTSDGFIFSLASDGALRYSTLLGGSGDDHIEAFTTDLLDSAFVTGWTTSLNVVDSPRPVTIGQSRGRDAFVAKMGSTGQRVSYYTYIGADGDESGTAIVAEPGGAAYVAGWTTSGNGFPSAPGGIPSYRNVGAGQDCFVVKLRFTGEVLDFSALIGGSGVDLPFGIAIDSSGGPYITGLTRSRNFPTTIVSDPESGSWFITRFAWPSNGQLAYSRFVARRDSGWGATIQVDAGGNAYVAGPTNSDAFPVSTDGLTGSPGGRFDIGLLKVDPDGRDLHASLIGGSGSDIPASASVLSPYGDLFLAGVTTSADLPTGRGAYDDQYDRAGDPTRPSDAFFLRFGFSRRPAIYAPPQIMFPVLRCDSIQRQSIWVYNVGDSDLLITSSLFRNSSGRLFVDSIIPPLPTTEGQPFRIPPGDSIRYVILYISKGPADNASDFLEIASNDLLDGRRPLAVRIVARRSSPLLIPSQTSVAFDPVLLCSPAPRTVTLRLANPGTEPVDAVKASLARGGGEVTILSSPATIAAGSSGEVVLRFQPTRAGAMRDTLVVLYGPCGDTLRIPLSGRADTAAISFGRLELRVTGVPSCLTSLDTTIRVTNTGSAKLTLDSARFDGEALQLLTVLPTQLDPGASVDLKIRALLPVSGNASAVLSLSATPCALRPEVLVVIEKSAPDTLQALQPALDFGVVAGCATEPSSKDLNLIVRNASPRPITLDPATWPAPFQLAPGSGIPAELAPGATFTVTVRFQPVSDGASSGTLRIPYRSGPCRDTLEVPLSGVREQAVLVALPAVLDFGRFGECVSVRDTVVLLENRSAAPIQVDEVSGLEGVLVRPTAPFAVSPNSRDTIRISFMPKQAGMIDGFITLRTSPCGDSLRVRVLAEKLGAVFTLGDGALTFPDRLACDLPRTFDTLVQLRGSGSPQFAAQIRSAEVIGEGFSVDQSVIGRTFSPLDVVQIPVRFTPPGPGSYAATVIVVLGPCNDTLRLRVEGRIVGASLTVVGATFDQIPVDSADTAEVIVVNTTSVAIDLEGVANLSDPFTLLSTDPVLPGVLAPGDSIRLTFRFRPGIPGTFEATPTARVLAPCGFDVILPLSGSAVAREDSLSFCIGGAASGLVGDTVSIPIDASPAGALAPPADIEYLIRYDRHRLQFLGAEAPGLEPAEAAGGELRLRQRGAARVDRRQATLRFRLLVGPEEATYVRLDSVLIGGDRRPSGVCADSFQVRVSDRCIILGMKLGKYANLLEPVRPNPAGSTVEITYQQLEDARAVLTLHDMEGREVLRPLDQELPGGRYTVRVDVSDLASGGYFYSISAGSWRESRMMLIAR